MERVETHSEKGIIADILVFHILPKLPVKSLFRFRCVCKNWQMLISQVPAFIHEQCRISPSIKYVASAELEIISIDGTQTNETSPSLKFLEGFRDVLASCNGLLCISVFQPTWTISVCNPATRELHMVPDSKFRMWFVGLAFDPLDSSQCYKLVFPVMLNDHTTCRFTVFSSDTGVWTKSEEKVIVTNKDWFQNKPVSAAGVIFWNLRDHIIWFDPKKDLGGFVLPPIRAGGAVGVWEDKLTYTGITSEKMIEAWIMSGFEWTRICQTSLDNAILGGFPFLRRWGDEGVVLPYQGKDFSYLLLRKYKDNYQRDFQVFRFNMKTGEVTESYASAKFSFGLPFFQFHSSNLTRLPKLSKRI